MRNLGSVEALNKVWDSKVNRKIPSLKDSQLSDYPAGFSDPRSVKKPTLKHPKFAPIVRSPFLYTNRLPNRPQQTEIPQQGFSF